LPVSLVLLAQTCQAGEIVLPSKALERDGPVTAVYRANGQATGKGELAIRWTDALGRVVEERAIPFEMVDETEVRFPLHVERAVAMVNELQVRFTFEGVNKKGERDHREDAVTTQFIAKPPGRGWSDYQVIMWQPHRAEHAAVLKTLGVSAGQYSGRAKTPPEFLLKNDLRWYAENLATDFWAEYHRFRADRIQNWSFLQAKELYKKDPSSKEAFKRNPSLSDPVWLTQIRERLVEYARMWSPYRPLFYDLGDESGIADLAAYWDFDFSDHSLAAMRVWLKERYGALGALNKQWGKSFTSWDAVTPETTNEAMRRTDGNYSAWSDHKEWMDVAFARSLQMGSEAIRSVDPDAFVAIAGAQMPGWGGYDYARLTQALQALEPYNIGNNIEIIRSLNPRLAMVTTSFARGLWEKHRIWYELLHGARGNLIWDEKSEHVGKDGSVGERGREVEPYYRELRGGLGAQLIHSARQADPIAIHYSQASMRADWMLAQRGKGDAWVNRSSSTERMDSAFLRLRESYCRLIEDLGLQYNFVSYGQVEAGELMRGGYRALILPRSSALSDQESAAIREFVRQGGLLIVDGEPGVFDETVRQRPHPALEDLAGASGSGKVERMNALDYHQQRLLGRGVDALQAMGRLLAAQGVAPEFAVRESAGGPAAGIETHAFRNGGVRIVGLLSNPQLRVNELGPPEFKSNERFEKPRTVRLSLPAAMHAYDLRRGKPLGPQTAIDVVLDPYEPALFALSPAGFAPLRITAPARLRRGETARIGIALASPSPAGVHVFHVEARGPGGQAVLPYSANVPGAAGRAAYFLHSAMNDAAGKWTLVVKDVLSGQERTAALEFY
jgi:hypothetical protein